MTVIRSNAAYRFTRSDDSKVTINDVQRERYDGADVLVVSAGPVHAQVEALDGATFVVEVGELTDEAATEARRFAGFFVPPSRIEQLERDEDAADTAAGYARGVADYAAYLRTGVFSDDLGKILD